MDPRRRRTLAALVTGNLLLLGGLALTTYDLTSTRRLVSDDLLDRCQAEVRRGATATTWREVRVTGPASVTARSEDGSVACTVGTPLTPWGPVVFGFALATR